MSEKIPAIPEIGEEMEAIAKLLNLGRIQNRVTPVDGGALHTNWLLQTASGKFVIKKINPYIRQKCGFSDNYNSSEQIARFFYDRGVPAIPALVGAEGNCLLHVKNNAFLVYPYLPGAFLEIDQVTKRHTGIVGAIFSKIHNCKPPTFTVSPVDYVAFDVRHWKALIAQSTYGTLKNMLPVILRWNEHYQKSIEQLNTILVVTHRDLHRENLLWTRKGEPFVVDWESAGLMNPYMEVLGYGIEWSGILQSGFDKTNFASLLTSYIECSPERNMTIETFIQQIKPAFYGWLGHCVLGWTEFNIRRALGMTSTEKDEICAGRKIIEEGMIAALSYIERNEFDLINGIDDLLKNSLK